jgi:hypothetical protein
MVQAGLYSNNRNLEFHLRYVFAEVDFEGRSFLDIGGGAGLHSFYAAWMGAANVVCLEPEAEGSRGGVRETFAHVCSSLGLADRVTLMPCTVQAFEPHGQLFDIVNLYNSVNHLDESACKGLRGDPRARAVYRAIFGKVSSLAKRGAKAILCDCSRHNFFPMLGLKNPLVPNVEWDKHQTPEVWAALLAAVGFANPRIAWTSYNTLRSLGRLLIGNKPASFFLTSHFRLVMEKALD